MRHVPAAYVMPEPADVGNLIESIERWQERRMEVYRMPRSETLSKAINYLQRYQDLIESIGELNEHR